ncbi:MAG TPA: alginate export family protein, partial [Nitrospiria bacterium]|nr:alginate export family protein [Nitrospiria bacterium]
MNRTDRLYFLTVILAGFFVMSLPVLAGKSYGAENKDPVWEALTGGKVSLNVRYRYEWVDMESLSKEAHASTVRTRLGYQTGEVSGFSGLVEFEDVTVVGSERYNNTKNGKTEYPVVADPEDTEVNQAYLAYRGLKDTVIKVGRQKIFLDNARFIGNVGWRQNEQTFDAVLVQNRSVPDLTGTYAYLSNVNRVFGGHHPTRANFRVGSHLVNVAYTGFKPASATVYGYFIDFDDVPSSSDPSTKTLGGQLKGSVALSEGFSLLYFAELADQTNHAGGLETNDARYMHFYAG